MKIAPDLSAIPYSRPRCKWYAFVMMLKNMMTGVLLIWSLSSTGLFAAQQDQPDSHGSQTMVVKVVDAQTSQPISHASLRISWNDHKQTDSTDDGGTYSIQLPPEYGYVVVYAQAPGYAAMRLGYYGRHGRSADIPDKTVIELSHAVTIGGRVINEEGQPVTGALVTVSGMGDYDPQSPIHAQFDETKLTTDDQGRWTFDSAPEPVGSLTLKVEHPDYVAIREYHAAKATANTPASTLIPQLHEMTGTTTLQKGVVVQGNLLGPDGKPIHGATIAATREKWGFPEVKSTSDEQGHWSFHALPGDGWLLAEAEGVAPCKTALTVQTDPKSLDIHMENGWHLRGRAVDPLGNPRPNVSVSVEYWGERSFRYPLQWREKTDKEGRFQWRNAPSNLFALGLYGGGAMRVSDKEVTRSDEEIVFTMYPQLRFVGTVVDAESRQPIKQFTVVPGWGDAWSRTIRWDRSNSDTYADGTFEYVVDFPRERHQLRIEADGHLPFESAEYTNEDGLQHLDVALEPADAITAIVKNAAGALLSAVEVHLVTRKSPYFLDGRAHGVDESDKTTTDANGKFSFTPQSDPFAVLAMNDSGVCIIDGAAFKGDQTIVLEPWAKVEGDIKTSGKPCAGRSVSLTMYADQDDPRASVVVRPDTTTDDSGHFVFDKVPPGLGRVDQLLPIGEGTFMSSLLGTFEIKAGETVRIDPASHGLNIIAKVVLPKDNDKPVPFTKTQCILSTNSEPPRPDNWSEMSNDDKQQWWKNWMASDEARQWRLDQFRHERYYLAFLSDDGSLRFEGIESGDYKLRITVNDPQSSGMSPGDAFATLNQDVSIPTEANSTVDLGELELAIETNVRIGDQAPDFAVTTLDDKPLKLADYRGKYVFLDFWATWCGPCKAEIPNVKAMHQALRDRDDFVVISLSLDKDAAAPRKYAQDNQMTWTQGFLGDWSSSEVPKLYGVRGIPATFLIGPDGKVVAKEMRGAEMLTKVQSALKVANR